MARLLTIVNERKRLRNLYRMHLEDSYIAKMKEREMNEFLALRDRAQARGEKNLPLTKTEVGAMLRSKENERMAKLT